MDIARLGKVAGFSADGEQLTEWAQVRSGGSTDYFKVIRDDCIAYLQWIGPTGVATLPMPKPAPVFDVSTYDDLIDWDDDGS